MTAHWKSLLPLISGRLPNGTPIHRTEPGGTTPSPVAILGVYPAATRVAVQLVGATRMNLPQAVERHSFEPDSASGRHLDEHYLAPLDLGREQVFTLDMLPYFMANTAKSNGRSMWTNIQTFERVEDVKLGIVPRPKTNQLLEACRSMPGNMERLREYLSKCQPGLLITLGNEAAAFVRGFTKAKQAQPLLYSEAVVLPVVGLDLLVVHLTHPGNLMRGRSRNSTWWQTHQQWCSTEGRTLVRRARARWGD